MVLWQELVMNATLVVIRNKMCSYCSDAGKRLQPPRYKNRLTLNSVSPRSIFLMGSDVNFQVYRSVKFYYIVESRTVWPNLWRVINLIHILLILAHWFGCFYYLLSEAEGFQVGTLLPLIRNKELANCCCTGRLGVSIPSRRLRHPSPEVPGLPLLVNAHTHYNRGSSHPGNQR